MFFTELSEAVVGRYEEIVAGDVMVSLERWTVTLD